MRGLTRPLIRLQGGYAGNPIKILKQLDRHQWLMFIVGWLGWMWDAFDFFTVSLTVTEIAKDFGVKNSDVSWVSPLPSSLALPPVQHRCLTMCRD